MVPVSSLSLLYISREYAAWWSVQARLYMPCLTGVNASKFLELGFLDPTRPVSTKTRRRHSARSLRLPFRVDSSNNVGLSTTADFQESSRRIRHSPTAFPFPAGRCSKVTYVEHTCTRLSEAAQGPLHADLDACGDSTAQVSRSDQKTPHMSGATPPGGRDEIRQPW